MWAMQAPHARMDQCKWHDDCGHDEAGPTDLVCLQRMRHDMAALERRG